MTNDDTTKAIAGLSEELALDALQNLDAPVAACPGWLVRDLVAHVTKVQAFWANIVQQRITDRSQIADPADADVPESDAELIDAFRAASRALVDALNECPADEPLWTWWPAGQNVGFVLRRQLNEVAMHGFDARHAVGDPRPFPVHVARPGLDEFVEIMSLDLLEGASPMPVRLVAADTDWSATIFSSDVSGEPALALEGTASDLLLQLWGRLAVNDPEIARSLASVDRS